MVWGMIGKKIGMTHVFKSDGKLEAVTAIESGPCWVIQIKTVAKEGYDAVQLGFGKLRKPNSPQKGHLKGLDMLKYLREFKSDDIASIQIGQKVDASLFQVGELINIIGISKGRGFAGVVKRHHFAGGPKTHGQSDRHRAPGSIGSTTSPGRVLKGMRMAGHMGNERVTIRNLEIVTVDPNRNLLLVKGAVPGSRNAILIINKAKKER